MDKKRFKGVAIIYCDKCGKEDFSISKKLRGNNKDSVIIQETMSHSGYGWDISSFIFKCHNCGSTRIQVKVIND